MLALNLYFWLSKVVRWWGWWAVAVGRGGAPPSVIFVFIFDPVVRITQDARIPVVSITQVILLEAVII